eukprot:NODE_645_length_5610_cov_0.174560.p3 type:complete len:132 gc:universal NODE_645_length_5610_cov_0.174560:3841-4236(+)
MGFNDREIVILSGAHALGRCHPERSGFEGPWMKDPFTFTNEYFGVILHDEFAKSKSSVGNPQFENKSKPGLMMLITDLLLRDDPEFKKWTVRYANDKELFFDDFSNTFKKLVELGWEGKLKDVKLEPLEVK